MKKELFEQIETVFFENKRIYDEGGMSNDDFRIWNDLYDCACTLILKK